MRYLATGKKAGIEAAALFLRVRDLNDECEPARRESIVSQSVSPHPVMESSNRESCALHLSREVGGRYQSLFGQFVSLDRARKCNEDVQDKAKRQILEEWEAGNDPKGLRGLRVPHRQGADRRWQEARRPSELVESKVGIKRSEKRASTEYVQ